MATPWEVLLYALGIAAGIVATAAGVGLVMFLHEQAGDLIRNRRYDRNREREAIEDAVRARARHEFKLGNSTGDR